MYLAPSKVVGEFLRRRAISESRYLLNTPKLDLCLERSEWEAISSLQFLLSSKFVVHRCVITLDGILPLQNSLQSSPSLWLN